ncbi:ABC transporter ATP-binding protein [Afipia felis]|uniref:Glutathione import ATP-binding protein GsiA n=2 Tax=Afipia felis TaxID=1035 RepID=A0A380W578_AFIFE|nr:ABC transporter ATP-binding protein [Afipia felis]EKS30938.1 oligopeptide/dipeptide ABC transporter [Afipia felis ATCC 53690]SUU75682.1 Glutathione import ATP-binding protein GsiA [Afipia felis]SUU83749.1 Glutathione import ATP-binding protein GsiA [Afipia felis]
MQLSIRHLKKSFMLPQRNGWGVERKYVHAVNDVSLSIGNGESFGIVGESGSGKSTLARLILGLEQPTDGSIELDGRDVANLSDKERRSYWKRVQIIFQDPFSSLNPRMRIGDILAEPIRNYDVVTGDLTGQVEDLLNLVGLPSTATNRYPHELSGGQRQRVAIAAALAVKPDILLADEAVSALDVSVQAQIINLLSDLKKQFGLTYIFITHDLNLSSYFCDRVAVLYLGQIMEVCASDVLLGSPAHPYTQALISAVPAVDPAKRKNRTKLTGEIPSPINPPKGCPFHPRCPLTIAKCSEARPPVVDIGGGHLAACHVVSERLAQGAI